MNSSPARFTDGENQSILAGGEWALQVFSEARLDSVHTDARAGPPAETSLRDLPFDHSPTNNDTCAVDAASSINYNSLSDATATNANAMSEQRVTRTAPARTDHHGQDQLVGKEAVSAPAHGPEVNPFSFYPSQRLNGARRSDLSVTNELEIKAEAQLLVLAAGLDRVRGYAVSAAPEETGRDVVSTSFSSLTSTDLDRVRSYAVSAVPEETGRDVVSTSFSSLTSTDLDRVRSYAVSAVPEKTGRDVVSTSFSSLTQRPADADKSGMYETVSDVSKPKSFGKDSAELPNSRGNSTKDRSGNVEDNISLGPDGLAYLTDGNVKFPLHGYPQDRITALKLGGRILPYRSGLGGADKEVIGRISVEPDGLAWLTDERTTFPLHGYPQDKIDAIKLHGDTLFYHTAHGSTAREATELQPTTPCGQSLGGNLDIGNSEVNKSKLDLLDTGPPSFEDTTKPSCAQSLAPSPCRRAAAPRGAVSGCEPESGLGQALPISSEVISVEDVTYTRETTETDESISQMSKLNVAHDNSQGGVKSIRRFTSHMSPAEPVKQRKSARRGDTPRFRAEGVDDSPKVGANAAAGAGTVLPRELFPLEVSVPPLVPTSDAVPLGQVSGGTLIELLEANTYELELKCSSVRAVDDWDSVSALDQTEEERVLKRYVLARLSGKRGLEVWAKSDPIAGRLLLKKSDDNGLELDKLSLKFANTATEQELFACLLYNAAESYANTVLIDTGGYCVDCKNHFQPAELSCRWDSGCSQVMFSTAWCPMCSESENKLDGIIISDASMPRSIDRCHYILDQLHAALSKFTRQDVIVCTATDPEKTLHTIHDGVNLSPFVDLKNPVNSMSRMVKPSKAYIQQAVTMTENPFVKFHSGTASVGFIRPRSDMDARNLGGLRKGGQLGRLDRKAKPRTGQYTARPRFRYTFNDESYLPTPLQIPFRSFLEDLGHHVESPATAASITGTAVSLVNFHAPKCSVGAVRTKETMDRPQKPACMKRCADQDDGKSTVHPIVGVPQIANNMEAQTQACKGELEDSQRFKDIATQFSSCESNTTAVEHGNSKIDHSSVCHALGPDGELCMINPFTHASAQVHNSGVSVCAHLGGVCVVREAASMSTFNHNEVNTRNTRSTWRGAKRATLEPRYQQRLECESSTECTQSAAIPLAPEVVASDTMEATACPSKAQTSTALSTSKSLASQAASSDAFDKSSDEEDDLPLQSCHAVLYAVMTMARTSRVDIDDDADVAAVCPNNTTRRFVTEVNDVPTANNDDDEPDLPLRRSCSLAGGSLDDVTDGMIETCAPGGGDGFSWVVTSTRDVRPMPLTVDANVISTLVYDQEVILDAFSLAFDSNLWTTNELHHILVRMSSQHGVNMPSSSYLHSRIVEGQDLPRTGVELQPRPQDEAGISSNAQVQAFTGMINGEFDPGPPLPAPAPTVRLPPINFYQFPTRDKQRSSKTQATLQTCQRFFERRRQILMEFLRKARNATVLKPNGFDRNSVSSKVELVMATPPQASDTVQPDPGAEPVMCETPITLAQLCADELLAKESQSNNLWSLYEFQPKVQTVTSHASARKRIVSNIKRLAKGIPQRLKREFPCMVSAIKRVADRAGSLKYESDTSIETMTDTSSDVGSSSSSSTQSGWKRRPPCLEDLLRAKAATTNTVDQCQRSNDSAAHHLDEGLQLLSKTTAAEATSQSANLLNYAITSLKEANGELPGLHVCAAGRQAMGTAGYALSTGAMSTATNQDGGGGVSRSSGGYGGSLPPSRGDAIPFQQSPKSASRSNEFRSDGLRLLTTILPCTATLMVGGAYSVQVALPNLLAKWVSGSRALESLVGAFSQLNWHRHDIEDESLVDAVLDDLKDEFEYTVATLDLDSTVEAVWGIDCVKPAVNEIRFQEADLLAVMRVTLLPRPDKLSQALRMMQRLLGHEPLATCKATVQRILATPSSGVACNTLASGVVSLLMAYPTDSSPVTASAPVVFNHGTWRAGPGERLLYNVHKSPLRQIEQCMPEAKGHLLSYVYKLFASIVRGSNRDILTLLLCTDEPMETFRLAFTGKVRSGKLQGVRPQALNRLDDPMLRIELKRVADQNGCSLPVLSRAQTGPTPDDADRLLDMLRIGMRAIRAHMMDRSLSGLDLYEISMLNRFVPLNVADDLRGLCDQVVLMEVDSVIRSLEMANGTKHFEKMFRKHCRGFYSNLFQYLTKGCKRDFIKLANAYTADALANGQLPDNIGEELMGVRRLKADGETGARLRYVAREDDLRVLVEHSAVLPLWRVLLQSVVDESPLDIADLTDSNKQLLAQYEISDPTEGVLILAMSSQDVAMGRQSQDAARTGGHGSARLAWESELGTQLLSKVPEHLRVFADGIKKEVCEDVQAIGRDPNRCNANLSQNMTTHFTNIEQRMRDYQELMPTKRSTADYDRAVQYGRSHRLTTPEPMQAPQHEPATAVAEAAPRC